ncbi:MAG TPA: hypothetical protein DDW52_21700 [Planctomycetaceae bacterium]|nr:hypothetical protein [Planctomycetaceae bacterium]
MEKHRWLVQPVLTLGLIIAAAGAVLGTLRGRPAIERPKRVLADYDAVGFQSTLDRLNDSIDAMAEREGLEAAPRADSLTVARRVSLALVGSGLSLEEVRALKLVDEDQRVQWWTNYLLEDDRWSDYFAERFARAFVGTADGPFLLFRRRKFNMWLSDQFQQNRPYDETVADMLAAEGLWTDTPQVNFITATMSAENEKRSDPVLLAGRVSRALLAQRIDCLQCHDDFLGTAEFGSSEDRQGGTQMHFHALASFFSGTALPDVALVGIREDGRDYEVQLLGDEEPTVIEPDVPFDSPPLPIDGKPRERLAEWVTHQDNRAFARATVNRVWALLLSRPLVDPVDNIPAFMPVPDALDVLAEDFAENRFDIKRLIRLIVKSNAFQRGSRADFAITEQHEEAWAAFPITQLRPEQVAKSIAQACRLRAIDEASSIVTRLQVFGQSQDFLKRFGDRGEDEFDSDAVTIAQRLLVMNGNVVRESTKNNLVGNASSRIAALVEDDSKAINAAFLATLNREPSAAEAERFIVHLAGPSGNGRSGNDRAGAMEDVFWAIINSTEFSWNH